MEARAFAARTGDQIDANAELLALAGTNAASCLVRGMPVSSSGSRTVIGLSSGSRTQLFSLVMAMGVVVALLVFRPVLEAFPVAALGGIVVYAALRLIDFAEFRRLLAFRRNEFLLALAAMLGVLVLGILYGVLLAVALSVAELLYRVARPHDGILGIVPGLAGMHDIDDYPEAATGARPRRLPLRLAAVLRQRPGLPPPRAGRGGTRRRRGCARCGGSCSTPRPTSRSTPPRRCP